MFSKTCYMCTPCMCFLVPDPDLHVEIFHSKGFGSREIEGKLLSPSPLCHCWQEGHEATFNWEEPRGFLQITGIGSREVLRDGTHSQTAALISFP